MMTLGKPPSVMTMITLVIIGSKYPAGSIVVRSGDCLLTPKVNWNPVLSLPLVHLHGPEGIDDNFGAGTGSPGPIIRLRWIPWIMAPQAPGVPGMPCGRVMRRRRPRAR